MENGRWDRGRFGGGSWDLEVGSWFGMGPPTPSSACATNFQLPTSNSAAGRSRRRPQRLNLGVLNLFSTSRRARRYRPEPDGIAGLQLSDFPQLALHDGGGADKTAQARPVGPEDDRHVAGEIDRADGVRVVVDVGRMQPGFAAVGAGPLRLRADQAHPRAGRVVVHLVGRREQGGDVPLGEEIRSPVGAIQHGDFPEGSELRDKGRRQGSKPCCSSW